MADNLFKDSDPNCGVPEVPVVDFKFVDDCFIEPTPPPIFECVLPPVPNEPCIECPTFDGGGTINVGYTDPGDGCPKEPRIDVKVEKKGDACEYDFTVDLDIPIPRPPCPEINVNTFEVQTRFNSPGCCTEYETDVNVDLYADLSAVNSALIPNRAIVRTTYAAASNVITVNTIEERNALLENGTPPGPTTVVKVLQPEVTAWKLTTIIDGDVGYLTWMAVAANEFAKYWINDGTETDPIWRELVPENSPEACENVFTVTPRHRAPVDCNDPGECAFDIDLKIAVPIPRIPCPEINVTTFNVDSHWERDECCPTPIDVESTADRDALTIIEAPVGAHVKTQNPAKLWERVQTDGVLGWEPVTDKCQNRFEITTRHVPPVDCNDPGQCIFDIDLEIDIPLPPIPCPTISGRMDGPAVGYENRACVECISDATVRNQSKLNGIPVDKRKTGMYVAVKELAAFYTLGENLTTWTPVGYDRPIRSTNELNAIPSNERDNVLAKLSKPPELYQLDNNNKWQPVYAPEADFTVSSLAERDALPPTTAPVDSVVKISTPVSFWKRVNASVWTEISATENFDLTVQPVGSASATVYALPTTTAPVNSIVRVAAGVNFWLRTGNATWTSVANPTPTKTVNKFDDLNKIDEPSPGDVVKLKTPPNRFSFVDGEWVPQDVYDNVIVVYSEEDLNTIAQDEREAGMLVEVRHATDRYRLVGDPANPIWEPARCPQNKFEIFTRVKKPKDCKDPGECKFDIVLELVIPVPKPPCPVINIDGFKVTSGFTGFSKNQDDTCPQCDSDLTVDNYRDAEMAAAGAEPGTTINLSSPVFRYKLEEDLVTWSPAPLSLTINVQNGAALDALVAAGSYPTGDPENPTAPLLPGQRVTVASPDNFYKLGADLVTWTPERTITNVPPSKVVQLNDQAELQTFPADRRFAGLYATIENPLTDLTLNADGETWGPTVPDLEVNTEKDRDEIPEEDRVAGMHVFVKSATTRVKVGAGGKLLDAPCPRNVFTVTTTKTPGQDCNEPDQCEFDINLEINVPIPRIPCPIINVNNFKVQTHFRGDNGGGNNDEECCIERDYFIAVAVVANAEARDALPFESSPQGSYAKTTDNGKFWIRISDVDPTIWEERPDPNAPICGNVFTVTPRHRSPENCQDPGQCEFEIDLFINIPIPRTVCPAIETEVNVVSGYADSPCVNCESDMEVADKAALDAIPEEERKDGMRVKIKNPVTKYTWTGNSSTPWSESEYDTTTEPDKVVANWGAITAADQVDGIVIDIETPPKDFLVGRNSLKDGQWYYEWEPVFEILFEGTERTFSTIAERDAYYSTKEVGYHSESVTLLNPPARYTYKEAGLPGDENGLPQGWVGVPTAGAGGKADITVTDENEMRKLKPEDLTPGTVVALLKPTNRYKLNAKGEWEPDPCPSSRFSVVTEHTPGKNCDDPGECSFKFDLEIVVPIPKPPCPEINVTTFDVRVVDKDCVAGFVQACKPDVSVATVDERDAIPIGDRKPGLKVFVEREAKLYGLSANLETWNDVTLPDNGCCLNQFVITTRHEDNKIQKTFESEDDLEDPEKTKDIKPGQLVAVKVVADIEATSQEELDSMSELTAPSGTIASITDADGNTKFFVRNEDDSWQLIPDKNYWRAGDGEHSPKWSQVAIENPDCNDEEKCIFDIDVKLCIPVPNVCPELKGTTKTHIGFENQPCVECTSNKSVKNRRVLDDLLAVGEGEEFPPKNECNPDEEYKGNYYVKVKQVETLFNGFGASLGFVIDIQNIEEFENLDPEDLKSNPGDGPDPILRFTNPPKIWKFTGSGWVPAKDPTKNLTYVVNSYAALLELDLEDFPPGSLVRVDHLDVSTGDSADPKFGDVVQRLEDGSWLPLETLGSGVANNSDRPTYDTLADLLKSNVIPSIGTLVTIKHPENYFSTDGGGALFPKPIKIDAYVHDEIELLEASAKDPDLSGLPKEGNGVIEVVFPTDRYRLDKNKQWQPARCPRTEFRLIRQQKKKDDCEETPECILNFFTDLAIPIPVPPCPVFTPAIRAQAYYETDETCPTDCEADLKLDTVDDLLEYGPIGAGPDSIEKCSDLPKDGPAEGTTAYVKSNKTRWRWLTQHGGWEPADCSSAFMVIPKKTFDEGECKEPPKCEFDVVVDIVVPVPQPPCPIFNTKKSDVNLCDSGYPRTRASFTQRPKPICKDDRDCEDKKCIFDFEFELEIPCPITGGGTIDVAVVPYSESDTYGGSINVSPSCEQIEPENQCPGADHQTIDIIDRDRKLYELVRTENTNLVGGATTATIPGPPPANPEDPAQEDTYTYQSGAECGEPVWTKNGGGGVSEEAKTQLDSVAYEKVKAYSDGELVGKIFKTDQPLPHGAYWRYLGGVEDGNLRWEEVICDPETKPVCAFDFDASIVVPICKTSLREDDDCTPQQHPKGKGPGCLTGIPHAEKVKILYIKPYESCPGIPDSDCPEADAEVDDMAALKALAGELPGKVTVTMPGGAQKEVSAIGLQFEDSSTNVGEEPGAHFYYTKKEFDADNLNMPKLPLVIVEKPFGENSPDPENPIPRPRRWKKAALADVEKALGKAPDPNLVDGYVVKVKDSNSRYQLKITRGNKVSLLKGNFFWRPLNCSSAGGFRLEVRPDPQNPCGLVYQTQLIMCVRQHDHITTCTTYFGEECCDPQGCPCEPPDCCDDEIRKKQDDGSEDIGNPYYDQPNPRETETQSPGETPVISPFTAAPDYLNAPGPWAPQRPYTTLGKSLPRLFANETPTTGDNSAGTSGPDMRDPANDPCVKEVIDAGQSGCSGLADPTDKGYRPYKHLEVRVKENYPQDRTSPPVVEHYLEAAMNCLHGGDVHVKSISREEASGVSGIAPDDIGYGSVNIENNRVNVNIKLFTKACPEDTTATEAFTWNPVAALSAAPVSPELAFLPPEANFDVEQLQSPQLPQDNALSPALLESFIHAINTNPELKAAIRKIVNEPD